MALLPTLVEPPQTRSVSPVGSALADGCRRASWSVWNRPQAAVDTASGRTAASSNGRLSGIGQAIRSSTTVYCWKAPSAALLLSLSVPTAWGEHSVAHPEQGDRVADLDDLTGQVGAQHRRVVQPAVGEIARDLDYPFQRIDRDGVVADDDLVRPGPGI